MKKSLKNLSLLFLCLISSFVWADRHTWSFKSFKGKTSLFYGDQLVTSFHSAVPNKPALHPLIVNDGQDITRAFPFGTRQGEKNDHPHHTGIWFAHGDVNGVDFWHVKKGKPGIIKETSFSTIVEKGHAIAKGNYEWSGPDRKVLLKDKREMTFTRKGTDLILDWNMSLTAQSEDVVFGDTKEGTFALRFHHMLDAKGTHANGRMINADGILGKRIWGKKSKWVAYSGTHESGKHYTVAVFDHPRNFRYPTTWHARDYGLLAVNPFGLKYFTNKKEKGEYTLKAGEELQFRYRLIFQSKDGDAKSLEDHYQKYLEALTSK